MFTSLFGFSVSLRNRKGRNARKMYLRRQAALEAYLDQLEKEFWG
jgi:uncharacterized membrane protein YeiB